VAGRDPLDRARWWDWVDTDTAQIPLNGERPILGSRVCYQQFTWRQDLRQPPQQPERCPDGHPGTMSWWLSP